MMYKCYNNIIREVRGRVKKIEKSKSKMLTLNNHSKEKKESFEWRKMKN